MGNEVTTNSVKLTKAEKKELKAKKEAEAQRLEAQRKAAAEELYIRLSGQSDATKTNKVRKDVREDLKEMYEKGEIDKDLYKTAKKETSRGSWFKQLFGKKKESKMIFQSEARWNKIAEGRIEGPDLSKKSEARLDDANLTTDDVYQIVDRNIGSDNYVNYSKKKKQTGELDAIQAELNQAGGTFTKKQTKKLLKEMGVDVEPTVRPGKVVKGMVIGGAAAAPLAFAKINQNITPDVQSSLVNVTGAITQKVSLGGFAPAIGSLIGGGIAVGSEINRVEDKVVEQKLPENVKTYDDYAKYVDTDCTKKGAEIMKKIAKFYAGDDGVLNREAMEKDLVHASGEGSVLNYEEAVNLHKELVRGKKIEQPAQAEPAAQTPPAKEICEIVKSEEKKEVQKEQRTVAYTVKAGEYWYSIAQAKYPGATPTEIKDIVRQLKTAHCPAGMKPTDAFQPDVMHLPETIKVGDKEFKYTDNAVKDKATEYGNVKTTQSAGNPFKTTETKTTYVAETCDGVLEAESQEALTAKIEEFKKQHPNKEVIVR